MPCAGVPAPSGIGCRARILLKIESIQTVLCRIYDLYCDFVLKNPFYEVEMPIRCELFDSNLFNTINGVHRRWGLFN